MSLTGGFDLAIAISSTALRGLILQQMPEQLPIKKPVAMGPWNFSVPLGGKTGLVTLYAVLRKLTPQIVDVGGTPTLRLLLRYDQASLSGAILPKQICPISGGLTIDVPITVGSAPMQGSSNLLQQAQVDLLTATFTNKFDDGSVDAAVPGGGAVIGTAMTNAFKNLMLLVAPNGGKFALGPAIPLTQTGSGSLNPLVLTALKLRAINGGLVLFMNLDGANRDKGDVNSKQSLDLPSGKNIALHMSAACFHQQVFCPGLAKQFNVPVAKLPTSCGGAGSLGYYLAQADETINITRLADSFQPGRIVVDGSFAKSGTCYDLKGGFTGQITFPLGLSPKFDVIDANSDFDIPWYCKVAAAVVGTLTGGALFGALAFLGVDLLETGIDGMIGKQLKNGLGGFGLPTGGLGTGLFGNVSFNMVVVTSEGLTVGGYLPTMAVSWTDAQPSMSLEGAISTTNTQIVEQGTVKKKTLCTAEKDYKYSLQIVSETAAYDVALAWVVQPLLGTEWRILIPNQGWTGAQVFPLSGFGTLTLPQIETVVPNLNGPLKTQQTVTLAYSVTPAGVTLTNLEPTKGAYTVRLEATTTLCGGAAMSVQQAISFQGMVLDIVGFDQDVNDCTTKWYNAMKASAAELILEVEPTILQKVDRPSPERFRQFYDTMLRYARRAGADGPELATMLGAGHVQSMVRTTLHGDTRRLAAISATSDAAVRAAGQARFDAANAALATAQAAVEAAQAQLADAQLLAADVRLSLATRR